MKTLLLITEDWPEIHDAVKDAKRVLGLEIDIKKIDLDVSNEAFYETKTSLDWFKIKRTKSLATNIIYALGLAHGGKDYDCYGLIVDKHKSKAENNLWGQHTVYNGQSVIEVYAKQSRRTYWGYPYTTYTLIHELIHALDAKRGVGGEALHKYLKENDTLDEYIATFHTTETNDLLPAVQRKADKLIKTARLLGLNLRITSGYRSKEEQDQLYAQGRTTEGNIVTNAKGGESLHNYGVAFDIVDRQKGYNLSNYEWKWLNVIGSFLGLEWGGNWESFPDKPHFQYIAGYTLKDFQEGNVDYNKFQ